MTPEQRFLELWGILEDLSFGSAILQWDQETYMPPAGAEARGKILATLAEIQHGKMVASEMRDAIEAASEAAEPGSELEAQVREARRLVDREVKIPAALAKALAEAESAGLVAWQNARKEGDFSLFRDQLQETVRLNKEKASALAGDGNPYDAMLDLYEPGTTEAHLVPMFAELGGVLAPMIQAVADSGSVVDESPVQGHFDPEQQRAFTSRIAAEMGYDFDGGRLDKTTHPFCTTFGRGDVRITWRYQEDDIRPALYGVMHEAGHGLYEQGIGPDRRSPIGGATGLGMHESQSRLWENMVGRSEAFWEWAMPHYVAAFPDKKGLTPAQMLPALNTCKPSLIRVEADEATYNLHVAARFEIERQLFADKVTVDELPELWDQTYQDLLGIRAESVSEGVLQDIHWAMGAFGYFPTYSLGNLICAQLFLAADDALGDLNAMFAKGEFAPLLGWLRENIHQHGKRYSTHELVRKATGEALTAGPLLHHLTTTAEKVYGVSVGAQRG
ncbi:MAG: carboxypeptidase M32 [Planctomycetota bacterium]|jgi:carboxypeptidase Taq